MAKEVLTVLVKLASRMSPGSLVQVQGQPILPSGCATWLRHSTPAVDVTHPQPFTQPNHVMHGP